MSHSHDAAHVSSRMSDPDIILYLYANDGFGYVEADKTITDRNNKERYVPGKQSDLGKRSSQHHHDRTHRDSTEPLDGQQETRPQLERRDCLAIRFSQGSRTPRGVVMGRDANADVVVPDDEAIISGFHVAFTFDRQARLIARDLGSTRGTAVLYDQEQHDDMVKEQRRKFDFLLQTPEPLGNKPPVLYLTEDFQFKIIVPPYDITSSNYLERVARFRQDTTDPGDIIPDLKLVSGPSTQRPTRPPTPRALSQPLICRKPVGKGSYGLVIWEWDATTGVEAAIKEPRKEIDKNDKRERGKWEHEAELMKSISHAHIVTFRGASFKPQPRLKFEYMAGGSLEPFLDLSTFENLQILRQLLSALVYLHGQDPPIIHRDIKPANILVSFRRPDSMLVKFSDFGLAKAAEYLTTRCGTPLFAAPEVRMIEILGLNTSAKARYDAAVDIWSLGVVIASRECGIPHFKEAYRSKKEAYGEALIRRVKYFSAEGNPLLHFILQSMLVIDPRGRKTAAACYNEALQLTHCDSRRPFLPLGSLQSHKTTNPDGSDTDDGSSTLRPSLSGGFTSIAPETTALEASIGLGHSSDEDTTTPVIEPKVAFTSTLMDSVGWHGTEVLDDIMNPSTLVSSHGSAVSASDAVPRKRLDRATHPRGSEPTTILHLRKRKFEQEGSPPVRVEHHSASPTREAPFPQSTNDVSHGINSSKDLHDSKRRRMTEDPRNK